jgi:hypothetical protein
MIKKLFLLILPLCFISCDSESITGTSDEANYMLWKSHNIHNYTIEQRVGCFCPYRGPVRITVRSDTILSVVNLSDSTVLLNSHFRSVDSLFGIIKYGGEDSLVIKYDKTYGYPEYLDINPQDHPVDGGILYETYNLHVD